MGGKSRALQAAQAKADVLVEQMTNATKARFISAYATLAHDYALIGADNGEIARLLGVDPSTVDKWLVERPAFRKAIVSGREMADGKVVRALHRSATGATVKERRVVKDAQGKITQTVELIKELPPSVQAGAYWLGNRQRAKWKDTKQVEHSGSIDLMAAIKAATAGDQAKVIEGEATTSGSEDDAGEGQ